MTAPKPCPQGSKGSRPGKMFTDVDLKDVKFVKELGKGAFGMVDEGVWSQGRNKWPVAIKSVKMGFNEETPCKEALFKELGARDPWPAHTR